MKQAQEPPPTPSHTTRYNRKAEKESAASQQIVAYEQTNAHLANERTFIAWSGVGVILVICAVPIARLSHTLSGVDTASSTINMSTPRGRGISSTAIGLSFLASGIFLVLLATIRFLTVQKQIEKGDYRPSGILTFAFLSIILLLAGILTLHLLFIRGTQ
jgi:putative membrane protein